jgi:hypothetical protein
MFEQKWSDVDEEALAAVREYPLENGRQKVKIGVLEIETEIAE